jgi:hypothetical protein
MKNASGYSLLNTGICNRSDKRTRQNRLFPGFLIVALLSYLAYGCGTAKGYLGTNLPDNELAVINGGTNTLTIKGRVYKEKVLIAKVDSLEVGNYYKGWPKNLKIEPGVHVIEVRHFRPWTYSNTYYGGGAIGGAIAGSVNEKNMVHYHYLLKFGVEKNQSYLIKFQTSSNDLEKPIITILNVATNETVEFESEEKQINNK